MIWITNMPTAEALAWADKVDDRRIGPPEPQPDALAVDGHTGETALLKKTTEQLEDEDIVGCYVLEEDES